MKRIAMASVGALMLGGAVLCLAEDKLTGSATEQLEALQAMVESMPEPTKQHEWLDQLTGEWSTHVKMTMGPGIPDYEAKGTETVKSLGGFWVVSEHQGTCPLDGRPFTGMMTLGYDPETGHYVGSWVDSMTTTMWSYKGTVDRTGKVLTLETEGPDPLDPTKMTQYRETIEIKNRNHRVFTSTIMGEDGEWQPMMTAEYRRK